MRTDRPKLPVWYRPWLVLPLSLVLLHVLGGFLTLPPNMIDPRKYPAFMDGGSNYGGSNVFFYSRVVMLLMGFLGFLSLSYVKPAPEWELFGKGRTIRTLLRLFGGHIVCFGLYYSFFATGYLDCKDDEGTTILFAEISLWYVVSAWHGVLFLDEGNVGKKGYALLDALNLLLLVLGFYCGYWLTGSTFDASMSCFMARWIRVVVQMAVYVAGMHVLYRIFHRHFPSRAQRAPGCSGVV